MLKREEVGEGLAIPSPFDAAMAENLPDSRPMAEPIRPSAIEIGHGTIRRSNDPDVTSMFRNSSEITAKMNDLTLAAEPISAAI